MDRLELSRLSNNGNLWVKTARGWVLRGLEKEKYVPTCDRICGRREYARNKQADFGRNVQIFGTKGQRKVTVNVCLSDFIKIIDFAGAVVDLPRQSYLHDVMLLFLKEHLGKVSGTTRRQLLKIFEAMVEQALVSELHIPRTSSLLACTLKALNDGHRGVGCEGLWTRHLQTVSNLCTKMEEFSYTTRPDDDGLYLMDLPKECILEIMMKLSDHRDLIHLGQTCSDLYYMSQDSSIWERLTQYHFTEKQMITFIEVTDDFGEYTGWQSLFRRCYKKYGLKLSYTDSLVICSACKTLHWMMLGHSCWTSDDKTQTPYYVEPVPPAELIQILNSS